MKQTSCMDILGLKYFQNSYAITLQDFIPNLSGLPIPDEELKPHYIEIMNTVIIY